MLEAKRTELFLNKSKAQRIVLRKGVVCRGTGLLTFKNLLRWLIEPVSRGKKDEPPIRELLTM